MYSPNTERPHLCSSCQRPHHHGFLMAAQVWVQAPINKIKHSFHLCPSLLPDKFTVRSLCWVKKNWKISHQWSPVARNPLQPFLIRHGQLSHCPEWRWPARWFLGAQRRCFHCQTTDRCSSISQKRGRRKGDGNKVIVKQFNPWGLLLYLNMRSPFPSQWWSSLLCWSWTRTFSPLWLWCCDGLSHAAVVWHSRRWSPHVWSLRRFHLSLMRIKWRQTGLEEQQEAASRLSLKSMTAHLWGQLTKPFFLVCYVRSFCWEENQF